MRQWDDGIRLYYESVGNWIFLPTDECQQGVSDWFDTLFKSGNNYVVKGTSTGEFQFGRDYVKGRNTLAEMQTFPLFEDAVKYGHDYIANKIKSASCDKECKPESCDRVKYTVSLMSGDIFQVNACEASTVDEAIGVVKNHLHTLVDKLDSYSVTVHV